MNKRAQHHRFSFFQAICSQLPVTRTTDNSNLQENRKRFDCRTKSNTLSKHNQEKVQVQVQVFLELSKTTS